MKASKKIAKKLALRRKGWELAKAAYLKDAPSRAGGWSKPPGSRNPRKS